MLAQVQAHIKAQVYQHQQHANGLPQVIPAMTKEISRARSGHRSPESIKYRHYASKLKGTHEL